MIYLSMFLKLINNKPNEQFLQISNLEFFTYNNFCPLARLLYSSVSDPDSLSPSGSGLVESDLDPDILLNPDPDQGFLRQIF